MDFHLGHTIAVLQRTPAALDALLRGLPDPWLHGDEGPDTWSPFVVVGHLIHQDETNWLPRAQTLLEHGEATVFADIDRFAQLKRFPNRPIGELLDLFARVRGDCLDRLEALKLSSEDLARSGTHPSFGRVTLAQLLATWTDHDLSHLGQIVRVMANQYAEAVGPWRDFLRILNS